jgi:muconolactone delta-isomerase
MFGCIDNRTAAEAHMEYLVTMTTEVPDDIDDDAVREVRDREAAHTRTLALEGRVLRLWRPPLKPGEWRTWGLFVADGTADLEQTLASMPLHVWRKDEATRLDRHPNDPGNGGVALDERSVEFLTTFRVSVPPETSPDTVAALTAGEARRARELADEGRLLRLWTLPGDDSNLGLWQASDGDRMRLILGSLPMAGWLGVETVRLTRHPSDPATAARQSTPAR